MTNSSAIPFKTWLLLIAVGILISLMNIDYTAVNLTLVPISQELDADLNTLQWLLSGYVLVCGAFVIPAGRIADIYGKRNTLIAGLIIFMLGSCFVGVGHSVWMLISGRIVQGCGAAIFTAPCWAVIFTSAPANKQGFIMGIVMLFSGAGLAVGPTLGGYLIEVWNWRWIYYINIPIGSVVIGILLSVVSNERDSNATRIDFIGTTLLATGLCLLVLGINQIEIWGICNARLWLVLVTSIALLTVFFIRDGKLSNQMIPRYLLSNKAFIACTTSIALVAMVFSVVIVLVGLYLQNAKGFSSYKTGIVFFAMTVSMGALSPFGGVLVDKFGVRRPIIWSLVLATIGTFVMAFLNTETELPLIVMSLFLVGVGLGGYFTAGNLAMMRSVRVEDVTMASGVYTMAMMLGNTISVILCTSLLVLFGRERIVTQITEHGMAGRSDVTEFLFQAIARPVPHLEHVQGLFADKAGDILHILRSSFVESFAMNMFIAVSWAVLALLIVIRGIKDTK